MTSRRTTDRIVAELARGPLPGLVCPKPQTAAPPAGARAAATWHTVTVTSITRRRAELARRLGIYTTPVLPSRCRIQTDPEPARGGGGPHQDALAHHGTHTHHRTAAPRVRTWSVTGRPPCIDIGPARRGHRSTHLCGGWRRWAGRRPTSPVGGDARGATPAYVWGSRHSAIFGGGSVIPVARCHPTAAAVARWENDDDS
jgi:hypothetical protein